LSSDGTANFGFSAKSVGLGTKARLFFEHHDVGTAINQNLTGITVESQQQSHRLFYKYSDSDRKQVLQTILDSRSLKAAFEYYKDVFAGDDNGESLSNADLEDAVNTHPKAQVLKGFYCKPAKSTVSVGDDVLIGNDNWPCRITRIVQHKIITNINEHTAGN
jgi:hypothetical protein